MCPGWAEHGEPLVSAGRRRGPGLCMAVQPSDGSLITQHRRGIEGLAARRQSLRRYHRNNPYPSQASKGFVRVPVCVFLYFFLPPPPPPSLSFPSCCFVCVHEKEFFLLPGKRLAPGLRSCEKRARERQADGAKENKHSRSGCMAVGGFEKEKEKAWRGGGGGSCGANESKINIYMGRVLKPYFASL